MNPQCSGTDLLYIFLSTCRISIVTLVIFYDIYIYIDVYVIYNVIILVPHRVIPLFISVFLLLNPRVVQCLYGDATLTNVTVASSETFLTLALVLVWLCVGAGPAVLAGLVRATVVQI